MIWGLSSINCAVLDSYTEKNNNNNQIGIMLHAALSNFHGVHFFAMAFFSYVITDVSLCI